MSATSFLDEETRERRARDRRDEALTHTCVAFIVGTVIAVLVWAVVGVGLYSERQYEDYRWRTEVCLAQGNPFWFCFDRIKGRG